MIWSLCPPKIYQTLPVIHWIATTYFSQIHSPCNFEVSLPNIKFWPKPQPTRRYRDTQSAKYVISPCEEKAKREGFRRRQATMAHSRWGSKFSTVPSNLGLGTCLWNIPITLFLSQAWPRWGVGKLEEHEVQSGQDRFLLRLSGLDRLWMCLLYVLMFCSAGCPQFELPWNKEAEKKS